MDPQTMTNLFTTVGAAYAGIQVVAQGVMAIQKVFTSTPEKTVLFKLCKWLVAGPSRWFPGAQ